MLGSSKIGKQLAKPANRQVVRQGVKPVARRGSRLGLGRAYESSGNFKFKVTLSAHHEWVRGQVPLTIPASLSLSLTLPPHLSLSLTLPSHLSLSHPCLSLPHAGHPHLRSGPSIFVSGLKGVASGSILRKWRVRILATPYEGVKHTGGGIKKGESNHFLEHSSC